jgi:hypothetical protein
MTANDVAALVHCSPTLITRVLKDRGVDSEHWRRQKIAEAHRETYRNGRQVPTSVGYGTKVKVVTPFQGTVMVRSKIEALRAGYLTELGVPWFYEVTRYVLEDGSTYLPDFWVAECLMVDAVVGLGGSPTLADARSFLARVPHRVEDVKGWWRADHPSYQKVIRFRAQYQGTFNIVVKTRDGWSCQ